MENRNRTISFDDMVGALADVQRRTLLVALLDHNPQDDSPVVIASSDADAAALDSLVSMRHIHLPKLADMGFIVWDRSENEVRKGPNFEEIKPLLELLVAHGDELPDDWL